MGAVPSISYLAVSLFVAICMMAGQPLHGSVWAQLEHGDRGPNQWRCSDACCHERTPRQGLKAAKHSAPGHGLVARTAVGCGVQWVVGKQQRIWRRVWIATLPRARRRWWFRQIILKAKQHLLVRGFASPIMRGRCRYIGGVRLRGCNSASEPKEPH